MIMTKTRVNWQAGNVAYVQDATPNGFRVQEVRILQEVDMFYSRMRDGDNTPRLFVVEGSHRGAFVVAEEQLYLDSEVFGPYSREFGV
jgi:hypothetical protein